MKNSLDKNICMCRHRRQDHLSERRIDENQPLRKIKRYFQCRIRGCWCKEFSPKSQLGDSNNKKRSAGIKLLIKTVFAVIILALLWKSIENPSGSPWIFLWGAAGVALLFWIFDVKRE
ncbi:MAG: hypothetical protein AABX79_01185 [Nanoarchaeota archaeon]